MGPAPADHDLREERRTAHRTAIEAALAALPEAAERLQVPPHVLDRVRDDFEGRLADLDNAVDDDDSPPDGSPAARSDWDAYRAAAGRRDPAASARPWSGSATTT